METQLLAKKDLGWVREAPLVNRKVQLQGEGAATTQVRLCPSDCSKTQITVLFVIFRHPWSFITVKGNPSSSVEDHIDYHGNLWLVRALGPSNMFLPQRP